MPNGALLLVIVPPGVSAGQRLAVRHPAPNRASAASPPAAASAPAPAHAAPPPASASATAPRPAAKPARMVPRLNVARVMQAVRGLMQQHPEPFSIGASAAWVKWEIEQPRCAADVPRANQPSWEWPARCEPSVAAPPSAFQRALEYKESIACKPPAPPTSSLPLRMPLRYARLPEVGPLTHHVACRKIRRVMAGPHGAAAAQPCRSQTRDTPPETPFATSSLARCPPGGKGGSPLCGNESGAGLPAVVQRLKDISRGTGLACRADGS